MDKSENKINKTIQIIFLIFFFVIICFGVQKAYSSGIIYYLILFAVLTLIPVIIKDSDILKCRISLSKYINFFMEKRENMKKIIKSNRSDDDKIKEGQKLIDEAFKLGYEVGGGRIVNNIQNVKFTKNKDGETTDVQFDEN
ncbi:hypothetical protein KAU09_01175 [Candidatus Parcubacteria bacterium]|nr:hypothetical protein [Candidatus Parcubacteria bacterium]